MIRSARSWETRRTARQNELQEEIRYMPTYGNVRAWLPEYYKGMLKDIFSDRGHRTTGEMVNVQNYIRQHYNEDLSLKELAEVACVSPTAFVIYG